MTTKMMKQVFQELLEAEIDNELGMEATQIAYLRDDRGYNQPRPGYGPREEAATCIELAYFSQDVREGREQPKPTDDFATHDGYRWLVVRRHPGQEAGR